MQHKKINVFKEFTPTGRTYELRGQGKKKEKRKSSLEIQDKQTPRTTLQKLSPKMATSPLRLD